MEDVRFKLDISKYFHGSTLTGLDFVESFVDDCFIFSKTFQEHLGHVKEVLQRLRDTRIQLRSEKCHFAYTEVDFLGHHITPEGRTPVISRVTTTFPTSEFRKRASKLSGQCQLLLGIHSMDCSDCTSTL